MSGDYLAVNDKGVYLLCEERRLSFSNQRQAKMPLGAPRMRAFADLSTRQFVERIQLKDDGSKWVNVGPILLPEHS